MIMIIGAEGVRWLEGEHAGWISLARVGDFVFLMMTGKINATESGNSFASILNFSAIFAFMTASILLFIISRKRKR